MTQENGDENTSLKSPEELHPARVLLIAILAVSTLGLGLDTIGEVDFEPDLFGLLK